MGLMIPLMAGLTPDEYDVTLCDERLEDIDFDAGWDLVGMTTTIGASLRAYQLADQFRKRGTPVVFGGFHATLQTEEALTHADAWCRVRPTWYGRDSCRTGATAR